MNQNIIKTEGTDQSSQSFITTNQVFKSDLVFKDFTLKLSDNTEISIQLRSDGYVNATQLCKAGGKLFGIGIN